MDILRKVKTDKLDAIKLANMALDRWIELREYSPADEIRQTLKICNRQYNQYVKLKTVLKNNLIALGPADNISGTVTVRQRHIKTPHLKRSAEKIQKYYFVVGFKM